MNYDYISARIPEALELYKLTEDPLALDAVRVMQELLTDVVACPQHEPTPMQKVVLRYLDSMDTARKTLGL